MNDIFISGDFINKYYFPVFVPIGITGNILSFLVSTIQKVRQIFKIFKIAYRQKKNLSLCCLGMVVCLH